jgi:transposase
VAVRDCPSPATLLVWTAPHAASRCASVGSLSLPKQGEPSVEQVIRIGLDTSKSVFVVHGVDTRERVMLRRKLRRAEMEPFFAKLPPTLIGLEACGGSHTGRGCWRGSGTRCGCCRRNTSSRM